MTPRAAIVAAVLGALAATSWALDAELRKQAKDGNAAVRADAARALAREGSADAARVLAELLADREPAVRDAAVLACEALTGPEAVGALATAAKSKDELTRRNCAEALGRTKCEAALIPLEALAKDPSPQVRADAADALWYGSGAKALAIVGVAASDKDPFVRAAAVEAAGRADPEAALDLVRKALADPDDGVRCVARSTFRIVAPRDALAGLAAAATDASWRVRAQCVDDAAFLRERPALDVLVALVADRVTRVSAAAHRALQRLSGKEIGRDAELWAAWWTTNRETWSAPLAERRDVPDDPKRTSARYHGLDIATDAGVFVADLSGSMKDPVGGGESRTSWDVAAEELRRTIGALPDSFVTNLVFFQREVHSAFSAALPLSKAARVKAEAFIAGGSPGQEGDLLGAVLTALADDATDTVFLLSDGAPSCGELIERSRVRAAIRQRNRTRMCVIDTIGFGATKAAERSFLTGVAKDSGGRAVFRGEGGR